MLDVIISVLALSKAREGNPKKGSASKTSVEYAKRYNHDHKIVGILKRKGAAVAKAKTCGVRRGKKRCSLSHRKKMIE